jgi:glycosyltransferase involved in cell wall biosynthesis
MVCEDDSLGPATELSIVIPSYGMRRSVGACLRSIIDQDTRASYEIIVVDSSDDGTAELVRTQFPEVRLIHLARRTHAAAARNVGIRAARAPIIAFLDADCVAAPDWVPSILAAHTGAAEIVGGAVLSGAPRTLAGLLLFAIEFAEFLPRRRPRSVRFVPSCNLSAKAGALRAVGLFPEEFERSHDLVLCWRYLRLGRGPIRFDPAIRVYHACDGGLRRLYRHLDLIGHHAARVRRDEIGPGSFIVGRPILVPLLVPFRYTRILGRLLRSSRQRWLAATYLAATPLVLWGLGVWARAFLRGMR